MNLAEKIIEARSRFLAEGITKEGKGYGYQFFDMPDIEPVLTKICKDLKLLTLCSYPENKAVMTLINAEKPEETYQVEVIPKDCVMGGKNSPNPIQTTGAMMSYMRRYLYITAFCISESDIVDDIGAKKASKAANRKKPNNKERENKLTEIERLQPGYIEQMKAYAHVQTVDELADDYIDMCLKMLSNRGGLNG